MLKMAAYLFKVSIYSILPLKSDMIIQTVVTHYTDSVLNTWFLKNQLLRIKTRTTENKRCTLVSLSWACIEQESTIIANAAFIATFSRIFTLLLGGALLVISHGHPLLFSSWNTRCIKANGNHRSNFDMVCWINIQSKTFLTAYFI